MRTDAFSLLLALALLRAAEGRGPRGELQEEKGRTILTQEEADSLHVVISQFITGGGLLSACFIVLFSTFKPFFTLFTEIPGQGVVRQRSGGVLGNVLSSIDLMDVAFNMMDVKGVECRKRAVCEFQKTASGIPAFGRMVENASSFVSGMEKYRDALDSGAALEDCNAIYKCIYSSAGSSARKRRDVSPPWMKLS
ncbi:uncharacterized protein LOC125040280 [Penaeus chinensis]|uniref:uncharacterized protein LOC125040280 n=1 Tax=Penaeus chinensis TaxID=139456 RepID=UPI001FB65BA1|nr:uncharacterized protein LOC125040280 [Penaeus chinensis]XP_047490788.1 uncharacterized protein LOC125040280 [Penaeus chinensis]